MLCCALCAVLQVRLLPAVPGAGWPDAVRNRVLTCAVLCRAVLRCVLSCRYDFFLQSQVLAGQMRYETEFDWGGTRIFVSTAIVEGLRCFFIEPRNGFFQTPTVYGRYDDEVCLNCSAGRFARSLCTSTPVHHQLTHMLMLSAASCALEVRLLSALFIGLWCATACMHRGSCIDCWHHLPWCLPEMLLVAVQS